MKRSRINDITKIAVLVALLCAVSQISIPTPILVPITLQALMVALIGYLLSPIKALITIIAYILTGAIGVPVFANLNGGIGTLFGYTGGFIFGFLLLAFLCSLGKGKIRIFLGILGVILCHIIGVLQYSLVAKVSYFSSFLTTSLPYIFKDFALVILAYFLSLLINKKIKKS